MEYNISTPHVVDTRENVPLLVLVYNSSHILMIITVYNYVFYYVLQVDGNDHEDILRSLLIMIEGRFLLETSTFKSQIVFSLNPIQ